MAGNNSTNGVEWYVKPTLDTVSFFEGLPAEFFSDGKNIVVNKGYLQLNVTDVKGQALNVIIPIVEAVAGQQDWDVAVASATGNVVQDLLTITLLNMGATGLVVTGILASSPPGWVIGGLALSITWYSASSGNSLGGILSDAVKNGKTPYTIDELLQDQHTTSSILNSQTVSITDSSGAKFNYNFENQVATIDTDYVESVWQDFLKDIVKEKPVEKIVLPDRTLIVENLSPIQLRNAIDGIDKVSFLLSNILIKVGEKLDLGSRGVYTVKGGDTLSVIAQKNGFITKQLVALNPWLFDEKRITFNYPTKVLIAEGTPIDSNTSHTINGENTADFIKDANGGNDTINGNSGDDEVYAGSGNDNISGGAGNDFLYGEANDDTINGDAGDDHIEGGAGSDTLHGGAGTDTLLGGDGIDYLYKIHPCA